MKKLLAFILVFFSLLGVAVGHAQEIYLKTGVGIMSPLRKVSIGVEVGEKIDTRYSIGLAGEISMTESNVSPKLTYTRKSVSLDAGFGWGHKWQKEGCNDHNYHTYAIGAYWSYPIRKHCSLYLGCSALFRSYQAHIGLHRGALKLCAGVTFDIKRKPKR